VKLLSATFEKTATRASEWPADPLPEFAFVGRSNVGKSSMLNALTRRTGLARVSATPGRTQALQFFRVEARPTPHARPLALRFCDLPGYGWAKVSKADRARWAKMIEGYLRDRDALSAVVLIVDARHEPQPSDLEALAWLRGLGRDVWITATKMDKLARNRRLGAQRTMERALSLPPGAVIPVSAVEGTGSDALWSRLLAAVRGDREGPPGSAGSDD
jgi:GTP-binding protein